MSWPAPRDGDLGVFKCRDHFHLGMLWPEINWDDEPDFVVGRLLWEEGSRGCSFAKAAGLFVHECERRARPHWPGSMTGPTSTL